MQHNYDQLKDYNKQFSDNMAQLRRHKSALIDYTKELKEKVRNELSSAKQADAKTIKMLNDDVNWLKNKERALINQIKVMSDENLDNKEGTVIKTDDINNKLKMLKDLKQQITERQKIEDMLRNQDTKPRTSIKPVSAAEIFQIMSQDLMKLNKEIERLEGLLKKSETKNNRDTIKKQPKITTKVFTPEEICNLLGVKDETPKDVIDSLEEEKKWFEKSGEGLRVSSPQQTLTRLPTLLTQLHIKNSSQKIKNDIKDLLNLLHELN